MKRSSKIALIVFLAPIVLVSCLKPVEYPIIPEISFKSFTPSGDSAALIIEFTDGDGDIGLAEYETSPPYDTSSIFYYNLFVKYYEKVNGVWETGKTIPAGDDIEFNYRMEYIVPEGQNKALKGEVKVLLQPLYYNPVSPDSDTIKYTIQMADRALHLSNVVETDEIIR